MRPVHREIRDKAKLPPAFNRFGRHFPREHQLVLSQLWRVTSDHPWWSRR